MARAEFEVRTANISSDFGYEMAVKWFGQEAVDSLPEYVRGPKKGKKKGVYAWTKVARGGWVSLEAGDGYVENRRGATVKREIYLDGILQFESFNNKPFKEHQEEMKQAYKAKLLEDIRIEKDNFRTQMARIAHTRCQLRDLSPEAKAVEGLDEIVNEAMKTWKDKARNILVKIKEMEKECATI